MFNMAELNTLLILVRGAERSCQCLMRNSSSPVWDRKIAELQSIDAKLNAMLTPIYRQIDSNPNSKFANH